MKRERWTETELRDLPAEESDDFERKSGDIFKDQGRFLDSVAKALSAFANSGGGSLILGVKDDGIPDGLPPVVGRAAIRDWLEQKIPHLLEYPLSDFRVHTVIKGDPSGIPPDKEVIVIDVGDSAAAPHQSKRDKIYYRREGGRSVPAPHFYLELLRQRLTNPNLEFRLERFNPIEVYEHDDGLFLRGELKFDIHNIGRIAAYDWQLSIREIENEKPGADYRFTDFPKRLSGISVPLSKTILPGCTFRTSQNFGFQLRPEARTETAIKEEIQKVLAPITLVYQLATETSPGKLVSVPFEPLLDNVTITNFIEKNCLQFFSYLRTSPAEQGMCKAVLGCVAIVPPPHIWRPVFPHAAPQHRPSHESREHAVAGNQRRGCRLCLWASRECECV